MHHFQILSISAATAAASPILIVDQNENNSTLARRSLYTQESLDLCAAAPNCETYETSKGTIIRFKEGHEPGTPAYENNPKLSARDDGGVTTIVTYGDASIQYGSIGASGTSGLIHHLYDVCHEGACDQTDASFTASWATEHEHFDTTLTLHADGQYQGWNQRNIFVDAMVAAAGVGEKCEDKTWMHGSYGGNVESGTVHQCTQTSYININHWNNGYLKGFMGVHVTTGDENRNWCAEIAGLLGGLTTILGGLDFPGAGGVNGASGFFGMISGVCS